MFNVALSISRNRRSGANEFQKLERNAGIANRATALSRIIARSRSSSRARIEDERAKKKESKKDKENEVHSNKQLFFGETSSRRRLRRFNKVFSTFRLVGSLEFAAMKRADFPRD